VQPFPAPSTKKRILVLEADECNLQIISHVLSHAGHEVDTTKNQKEAYDWYLWRGPYELVLAGLLSAKGMTFSSLLARSAAMRV